MKKRKGLLVLLGMILLVSACGSVSDEAQAIEEKLKNKDTFVYLVWGNTCPHCHKVMPTLDKMSAESGIPIMEIDVYIEENKRAYDQFVQSGKYGLSEIEWVPTLVYIHNGKEERTLNAFDWAIENENAELGYDIDESMIMEFIAQVK